MPKTTAQSLANFQKTFCKLKENITMLTTCPTCKGKGYTRIFAGYKYAYGRRFPKWTILPCPTCKNTGRLSNKESQS